MNSSELHELTSRFFALRVGIEQRLLDHAKNPITPEEAKAMAHKLGGAGELSKVADNLSPAKHLEAIWIERETERYRHYGAAAEATKNCRLNLQWEFELVRRLGSGPMTDAEAAEYLAQETGNKWEEHKLGEEAP